jgi:gamma-glutamylputrescine oxidase
MAHDTLLIGGSRRIARFAAFAKSGKSIGMKRQSITATSYYQDSANRTLSFPKLEGTMSADVVVVGGGYTGLSAALELAEAGYRVALVEATHIGSGASGRNGGQICTGFSSGQGKIVRQLGAADARKCFDIAEDAKRLIEARIAKHRIETGLQWGYLHCATKPKQNDELKAWAEELAELGYNECGMLSKIELEEKLDTSLYHGAMREARAGHFHPLNYCLGLADAAAKAGAHLFEHSPALEIDTSSTPYVRTAHGRINAKFIVLGGNAYLGKTVKPLYGRVMPVTSFIVTTEPLGENRAHALIRDNEAVADSNFILDYFRLTEDNRLLFGGAANYSTLEPADVAAFMKKRVLKVFPQLNNVAISHAWGGYIAITSNRIPDCGWLSPTCIYAHGYSGQGVALAGMYGKLMGEAIRGTAERFDLLSRVKHLPFPGGSVRTPMLVAAMLFYRLRDALG